MRLLTNIIACKFCQQFSLLLRFTIHQYLHTDIFLYENGCIVEIRTTPPFSGWILLLLDSDWLSWIPSYRRTDSM